MNNTETYIGKSVKQKHLDLAKDKMLQPAENLLAVFSGQVMTMQENGSKARNKGLIFMHDYLLLTDEKLILWARSLFSESTEVFHYGDIVSIEGSSEMFIGVITIKTAAGSQKISGIPKYDLSIATKMLREQVEGHKKNIFS